ncbi:hypothetical protein K440DRAFT_239114 [Wilcoxina mikolae CBS 423.85]|nr:hypothetical protein K440DRAFT_239114 [Wilcoxina mikolae CBS 423.85]
MQSFEFSPRTSCSSLATYPSYAECDTPITDDDMSSYSHKFPDYLYETISSPLPTYTTSPRGKGDLDPSLLFERINSPSTRPYAIYAKSSYNNEDEVLGSNPPQAPNALPSYTTSRGNYPPHKRTNSVPLRTASPLDRRDHDSNPPQAPTSPTSTYPPLPRRKGYLDRFDPSSSSGRINSPSSGPCTGPSPKNEDRNSGPPPEPTSLLPSYTTSFQRNFPCPPYERARSAPITTASPLERKDKNSNSPLEPTNRLPNYTTSRGNRDIRPRPLHAETLPAYAMSSPNDGDQNLHPPQVSTSPPSHNTTSWTLWNRT